MTQPVLYQVYHATDSWTMIDPQEYRWRIGRGLFYRHVADVSVSATSQEPLEQVFDVTNQHGKRHWTTRRQIVWFAPDEPLRSTSVGDVIVSAQTAQAWLVLPSGMKLIDEKEGKRCR